MWFRIVVSHGSVDKNRKSLFFFVVVRMSHILETDVGLPNETIFRNTLRSDVFVYPCLRSGDRGVLR